MENCNLLLKIINGNNNGVSVGKQPAGRASRYGSSDTARRNLYDIANGDWNKWINDPTHPEFENNCYSL